MNNPDLPVQPPMALAYHNRQRRWFDRWSGRVMVAACCVAVFAVAAAISTLPDYALGAMFSSLALAMVSAAFRFAAGRHYQLAHEESQRICHLEDYLANAAKHHRATAPGQARGFQREAGV